MNDRFGHKPTAEQVFGYVYAVLNAKTYRVSEADLLRSGFPRIPFPNSFEDFDGLSNLGWELCELHLLRNQPPIDAKFGLYAGKGSNEVQRVQWNPEEQHISINDDQGFQNVERDVWEFEIGSYAPVRKYLQARKGRQLTLDEIEHVERVIRTIKSTIAAITKIDSAYVSAFPTDEVTDASTPQTEEQHRT